MSGRVGIHEVSLQNLYVDTGALRVKHLYINYQAIAARMMVLLVGVVYMLLWPKGWFNLLELC